MIFSHYPRHNSTLVAMKAVRDDLGADPQDTQWAVRGEIDEDGTCRLFPLYIRDVPAWVDAEWEAPSFMPYSMEPDR
jgi:hypothetical protein